MAKREIYLATNKLDIPYKKYTVDIKWNSGFSKTQYEKNLKSLKHEIEKIKELDIRKHLEISTKSDKELGVKLSAKNLNIKVNKKPMIVEDLYQASKVKDELGRIIGFKYTYKLDKSVEFPNEPYGMYYDYIYSLALYENPHLLEELTDNYTTFTDIVFNPEKKLNTQARAAALATTLKNNNMLRELVLDMKNFKEYYREMYENISKVKTK